MTRLTSHLYVLYFLISALAVEPKEQAEGAIISIVQKNITVDLVLEPSSSKIQGLVLDVQAPGYIDPTSLEISYSNPPQDGFRRSTLVEYSVVRLPDQVRVVENHGHCGPDGCDFLSNTALIVDTMGVGSRDQDSYGWCSTKDLGVVSGNLIRNVRGNHRYHNSVPVHQQGSKSHPKYAKLDLHHASDSGRYVLLLANCNPDNEYSMRVEGSIALGTQPQSTLPPEYSTRPPSPSSEPTTMVQAILAPLLLVGILAAVYYVKDREARDISQEDAYNATTRTAGYKSLPMMDLSLSETR